jgi:hypothetical protein
VGHRLHGMACPAEQIELNGGRSCTEVSYARCPRIARGATTEPTLAGGPRVRIQFPPAARPQTLGPSRPPRERGALTGDREFESISLHRRVLCEPDIRSRRGTDRKRSGPASFAFRRVLWGVIVPYQRRGRGGRWSKALVPAWGRCEGGAGRGVGGERRGHSGEAA